MAEGLVISVFTAAQAAAITRKVPVALFAGALALAGAAAPVVAVEEIGSTSVIVKTVTGEWEREVRRLVLEDNIHRDEVIETAVSSAAEIIFLDDSRISLGPNTRVTLDRFVFDPDPTLGKFVMTTFKGVFRFVSGNLSKGSYVIRTPTATIGVRGTVFASVTRDDGTTVVIHECPSCDYRWQPEIQEQCLRRSRAGITVASITGNVVTQNQCGISTTVSADGTATRSGPPPDWAVAMIEELDYLLAREPGAGFTDRDFEGGEEVEGGSGGADNRSGHGDDSNPGEGDGRDNSDNEGSDNPGKG